MVFAEPTKFFEWKFPKNIEKEAGQGISPICRMLRKDTRWRNAGSARRGMTGY